MKKRIITYRQKIDFTLSQCGQYSPGTMERNSAGTPDTDCFFFSNMRLVHLIVTVTFAILTMISIVAALMICNPLFMR